MRWSYIAIGEVVIQLVSWSCIAIGEVAVCYSLLLMGMGGKQGKELRQYSLIMHACRAYKEHIKSI